MGEIYIIKNYINDKVYIGQTTQGSEVRFKQHLKLLKSNSKQLIHKAIKKYGKENFYFEILEKDIPINNLDSREEYWIKYYDSYNNGYNLCKGGSQSRKKEIPIQNEEEIIEKYKTGNYSLRDLEKEYGVNHHKISKMLKDRNVVIIPRNKNNKNLSEEDKINICNLYKEGLSTSEISEIFSMSPRTIRRYRNYN